MDSILGLLNDFRNGTEFHAWLPYLRIGGLFVIGFCWGAVMAVVQPDDVLAQLRTAIRMAGLSDKECAYHCGVSKSHWSERTSGVLPFSMHLFARLPEEVRQWFYVLGNHNEGCPVLIHSAARLARRQARMVLHSNTKAGVA